jgi:hypothetical protein
MGRPTSGGIRRNISHNIRKQRFGARAAAVQWLGDQVDFVHDGDEYARVPEHPRNL